MKPIPSKDRLRAALAVVRMLHEAPINAAAKFESHTTFVPVGFEDGQLIVLTERSEPTQQVGDCVERVPCTV